MENMPVRHHVQSHKIQRQSHFPSVFVLCQEQRHRECFQNPSYGLSVSHASLIKSYDNLVGLGTTVSLVSQMREIKSHNQ